MPLQCGLISTKPTLSLTNSLKPNNEIADLIFASANEALVEGISIKLDELLKLASGNPQSFRLALEYWSNLDDHGEDVFPSGDQLRQTAGSGDSNSAD